MPAGPEVIEDAIFIAGRAGDYLLEIDEQGELLGIQVLPLRDEPVDLDAISHALDASSSHRRPVACPRACGRCGQELATYPHDENLRGGLMAVPFASFATAECAYGSKAADLFPTVAATGIASTLGARLRDPDGVTRAIRTRRSPTGGIGAQPGQPGDAWSTCYAIESLSNLRLPIPEQLPEYLLSLHDRGGFAMALGQKPEIWATAFSIFGLAQSGVGLPDPDSSLEWIAHALVPTGGFTWSPAWASWGRPNVRATAFVIKAVCATGLLSRFAAIADLEPTVEFLVACQGDNGGFRLDDRHRPCLWGTGEAVAALQALGRGPCDADACLEFVHLMRLEDGGYRRGPDYPLASDLWATMHAIDARTALGDRLSDSERGRTMAFVESCVVAEGAFTYRPPDAAADVLATSGAAIATPASRRSLDFLARCRMPGDGGVAFMPGRGSEARSALWAVTALDRNGRLGKEMDLAQWAAAAQNPDGGFGPWEGRASYAVSTNAVLEALTIAGHDLSCTIDISAAGTWIESTLASCPIGHSTADLVDLSSLVCAASTIELSVDTRAARAALAMHRRGSAWRRDRRSLPGLLATYVALTAHQALGDLERVIDEAADWVRRLPTDASGTAWSAFSVTGGGPVPTALAALILATADRGDQLPNLTL